MTDDATRPTQGPVRVPQARVALSSASVYPESTASAFELAGKLGYDAVEVMVGIDPISQDIDAVRHLVDYYQLPVCAVHAPCLLITQRVWGTDPWGKLAHSAAMAEALGAETVVVHPPFRWQRDYAKGFVAGIAELEADTGVAFAVENMYPWRASRRELQAYVPSWNPVEYDYANVTIDLSHSSTAGSNPVEMAVALGSRLRHVHMTDGSGSAKDEHLVPGHGNQPCVEFLDLLADRDYSGFVVIEINTRKAGTRADRQADLAESIAFTRLHLVTSQPNVAGPASEV
ncbi:MAG: sugar phosphate isomerase/epimerase family protein, partial [Nocardioidaceae bacterium]